MNEFSFELTEPGQVLQYLLDFWHAKNQLTQIEAQLEERRTLLQRLDTIEQTMSLDLERKQAAQRAAEMAQQRGDF